MLATVAVLSLLGFVGWLIYRAVGRRPIKAHTVSYMISVVAGIYTFAFFLTMDLPQLLKVVVSIILGVVLIFLGAYLQRRRMLKGR